MDARHVEQDPAADERRERVDAQRGEPLVGLHGRGVQPAVQQPVVRHVRERVDVGADVAAGHDDLVGRRAAVGSHHVAVTAVQRHLERRVVGRLRHAAEHRLREVDDRSPASAPRSAVPVATRVPVTVGPLASSSATAAPGWPDSVPVVIPVCVTPESPGRDDALSAASPAISSCVSPRSSGAPRGVRPVGAARPPDSARGVRQPVEDVLHPHGPQLGVLDGGDGVERGVLRVDEDVADVVDRRDRGLRLLEGLDDLVLLALGDPRADVLVELVGVLGPRGPAGEPRLVDDLGVADEHHHALGDRLRRRRDRHPLVVAGAVGVARRVVDRAVAGALLDGAELVVHHGLHAEQRDDRLDDGEVDDLTEAAAAGAVALVERGHHGLRRGQRGDAVGEAERGQGRRSVGPARDRGEPAHRLGERAEAGARAVGPELAEPGDARHDQPRVGLVQPLGRRPIARGCRAGSSRRARRPRPPGAAAASAPASVLRAEGDRPLVAREAGPPQGTPSFAGPWVRAGSALLGCSTLRTSAP